LFAACALTVACDKPAAPPPLVPENEAQRSSTLSRIMIGWRAYFLDLRDYQPAHVAASLNRPMLVLWGGRDYQVTQADFDGWTAALSARPTVTLKRYAELNHLFVAGSGPSTPAEYARPGHVDVRVVDDIASWILAANPVPYVRMRWQDAELARLRGPHPSLSLRRYELGGPA
jgi:dienelactone hydrolase